MKLLGVLLILCIASPAAAQHVFGGCPRGLTRDVRDDGVVIEDLTFVHDPDGTVRVVPALKLCTPMKRRGVTVRGMPTCTVEGDATPAAALTRAPRLTGRLKRDPGSSRWKIIEVLDGRRVILRWRAPEHTVDCVGPFFLSPDRRTLAVEITRSKKGFLSEEDAKMVLPIRLPRPLP